MNSSNEVAESRDCLRPPSTASHDEPAEPDSGRPEPTEPASVELEGKRAASTRQRHAAVHDLLDNGADITVIAETLRLDCKTVRRYANANTAE